MAQLFVRASRLLVVFAIALAAFGAQAYAPGTDAQIRDRIEPYGQLRREARDETAEAAEREPRSGEEIYGQFCSNCHENGVAGAPQLVADAWDARIDKGVDELYDNTINGINAMPAGGTCNDCSEDELRATVDYMLDQL